VSGPSSSNYYICCEIRDSFLVSGGNGLLGQHVVRLLLERGERAVAVFDIVPAAEPDDRVREFLGDITDEKDFARAVQDGAPNNSVFAARS